MRKRLNKWMCIPKLMNQTVFSMSKQDIYQVLVIPKWVYTIIPLV